MTEGHDDDSFRIELYPRFSLRARQNRYTFSAKVIMKHFSFLKLHSIFVIPACPESVVI